MEEEKKIGQFSSQSSKSNKTVRAKSERILFLSEAKILKQTNPFMPKSTMKFKSPVFTGEVYVMKEKVNRNVKVYHITDGSDISSMKQLEKEEKNRVAALAEALEEGNDIPKRESEAVRPSAKFFGFE